MKHLSTLFRRYFTETATSGAYISMTVIYLLMIAVAFNWSSIAELFGMDGEQVYRYAVIDQTEQQNVRQLTMLPGGSESMPLEFADITGLEQDLPAEFLDGVRSGETPALTEEQLDRVTEVFDDADVIGVIRAYDGADSSLAVQIYAPATMTLQDQMTLQTLFDQLNRQMLIAESQLPEEEVEQIINSTVIMEEMRIEATAEDARTAEEKNAGMMVAYGISFIVFFMSIMYSSTLATAVATEKSSRVMEVIVTSVTPRAHLLARILAGLSTAFLQVGILLLFALFMAQLTGAGEEIVEGLAFIRPEFLIQSLFLMFFSILQYLLLAALFGSLVNTPTEASQAVAPLSMILVAGFYVSLAGLFNPDMPLLTVTSYLPLMSAMVMPMRLGATSTPLIHGWIAVGINAVFTVGLYLLTAAIYRGAVITYRTGGFLNKLKGAWSLRA